MLPTLQYTYDSFGKSNVIKETPISGITAVAQADYTYDVQNQLISETLKNQSQTYSYDTYGTVTVDYIYDNGGNPGFKRSRGSQIRV